MIPFSPFRALLVSACVLVTILSASAQNTPPAIVAKADALFTEWNKPGSPGAAVGVVHQGRLVYAKGFGESDVETGARISPATIFHVASVSKQFTAYGIVLLAQQGKLSLDDDIRTYLPEVPDFGKKITIRHLIHHTSGLRDQWNLLVMAGWNMDDVITKEHILSLVRRQKELNFEPGSQYAYCNTGYTLLAEIVSRVGKQPFREWMSQHVFSPLGMKNTLFYDDHERIVKGRAYSFSKSSEPGNSPYKKGVLSYANAGATSLFTTVDDLAKWITNFQKTTVGAPATMSQMLERGRLNKGDTLPYAFALQHGKYKGLSFYGHDGADAGFRSSLTYFPKEDYGFVVLSNLGDFNPGKKVFEMANIFLAGQLTDDKSAKPAVATGPGKERKVDPKLLDQYAGEYQLAPGFILSFRREGERFFTQATGQPQVEIFASSDSTFFLKVVDAQVTFHKPMNGKSNRLTLHQNGNHPANRVGPYVASKEALQQYAGRYYSPELETFYTIELKNDTLQLVHIHHGESRLNPIAKDRLQAGWWFVQNIEMVRNADQVITGLRMSNGRVRNLWFKRLPEDFGEEKLPVASKN